jgi:hypothetical protein
MQKITHFILAFEYQIIESLNKYHYNVILKISKNLHILIYIRQKVNILEIPVHLNKK